MKPLESPDAPVSPVKGRGRPRLTRVTRSRRPAHLWLWISAASMLVSIALERSRSRKTRRVAAVIRGWASPLLSLGIYEMLGLGSGSRRDRARRAS